jgi:hypothetical protein
MIQLDFLSPGIPIIKFGGQTMTYENAENGRRKNCRKWKMAFKAKM